MKKVGKRGNEVSVKKIFSRDEECSKAEKTM